MRFGRITGVMTAASLSAAMMAVPAASASVASGKPAAHAVNVPVRHAGLVMSWSGGTDWMGSYTVDGKIVDCLTPGKILAAPSSWRHGTYGTRRQSAELSYIMNEQGTSPSGPVAAGARIAMLEVLGRLGFYTGLRIPPQVAVFARDDLRNAGRFAGPYKTSMTFTREPTTPGQAGAAVLGVTSAAGHAVTGLAARFTVDRPVNAVMRVDGRTWSPQQFTRTGTGPVRVSATVRVSSGELGIGSSGKAFQTLVYGLTTAVGAGASYQSHPAGVKSTVECNCDGSGNVTGTVSQAAGAAEGRYVLFINGKAVTAVIIPPGKHGQTADLKATARDGAVVTFTVSYRVGGRWTPPVPLGGTFTVICPATPVLAQKCSCDVTLTLASPLPAGSPYAEFLVYTAAGITHAVPVPDGTAKTVAFSLASGQVTYQAVVVRGGTVVASTPRMIGGFA